MEAALVGILGAILGFATSFILEGRKRKWEREDRLREIRRKELEEFSNNVVQVTTSFRDVIHASEDITPEMKDAIEKIYSGFVIIREPTHDEKLTKIYLMFVENAYQMFSTKSKLPMTKDAYKEHFGYMQENVFDLQSRISQLIEETYK